MKAPQERKTAKVIDCESDEAPGYFERFKLYAHDDGVGIYFRSDYHYDRGGNVQGLDKVKELRDYLDAYIEYEEEHADD